MNGRKRAPIWWFGGKSALVPELLARIPEHTSYVELFGGSGALLFSKTPVGLNVYNDLDSGLFHFFDILRDEVASAELQRRLQLTLYSREEWRRCKDTWAKQRNRIEKARRWYVVAGQGFAANFGRAWGFVTSANGTLQSDKWTSAVDALPDFARFMTRHVQVEHYPALHVIQTYDGPDVLYYADPPYVDETRRDGEYDHEMSVADHVALLEALKNCQAKVLLSGYDSELYRDILADWRCERFAQTAMSVARTNVSGYKGKGKISAKQQRIECLFTKPNSFRQVGLFDSVA